jgi:hypothetical protein
MWRSPAVAGGNHPEIPTRIPSAFVRLAIQKF